MGAWFHVIEGLSAILIDVTQTCSVQALQEQLSVLAAAKKEKKPENVHGKSQGTLRMRRTTAMARILSGAISSLFLRSDTLRKRWTTWRISEDMRSSMLWKMVQSNCRRYMRSMWGKNQMSSSLISAKLSITCEGILRKGHQSRQSRWKNWAGSTALKILATRSCRGRLGHVQSCGRRGVVILLQGLNFSGVGDHTSKVLTLFAVPHKWSKKWNQSHDSSIETNFSWPVFIWCIWYVFCFHIIRRSDSFDSWSCQGGKWNRWLGSIFVLAALLGSQKISKPSQWRVTLLCQAALNNFSKWPSCSLASHVAVERFPLWIRACVFWKYRCTSRVLYGIVMYCVYSVHASSKRHRAVNCPGWPSWFASSRSCGDLRPSKSPFYELSFRSHLTDRFERSGQVWSYALCFVNLGKRHTYCNRKLHSTRFEPVNCRGRVFSSKVKIQLIDTCWDTNHGCSFMARGE